MLGQDRKGYGYVLNRMQLIWLGKEKSDLTRTRFDRISKGKELRGKEIKRIDREWRRFDIRSVETE